MRQLGKMIKKFVIYYLISIGLSIYSSLEYMVKGKNLYGRAAIFALYMTCLSFAIVRPPVLGTICLVYLAIEALLTLDMVITKDE